MKIKKTLKLVYWLLFQDGIEELQNRMKKIEIIQSTEVASINFLIDRITILEKQKEWVKNELGKLYNQTNNDSVHRRLEDLEYRAEKDLPIS